MEKRLGIGRFQKISHDPSGPLGHCYWNVDKLVRSNGGSAEYGWLILYWPGLYVEALHHAVWRTPGGALVDVTEKYPTDEAPGSTFVTDASQVVDLGAPTFIPSRYVALSGAPEVAELFKVFRDQLDHRRVMTRWLLKLDGVRWEPGVGIMASGPPTPEVQRELQVVELHARRVSDCLEACARLRS